MVETNLRSAERRRRILQAAWQLVLRQGLRAMTMEALAREAGIAKATLYAQFDDKEAVIAGVIEDMLIDLKVAYEKGMAGPGDTAERIGAALAGKYALIMRALEGSPHAREVFNAHYLFAERFATLDSRIETEIADELARAGVSDPILMARIVLAAAYGIAQQVNDAAAVDQAIRLMCRRMIAPDARVP